MTIYTRFGSKVEIVSAEEVTVLVELTRDAVTRWHYPERLPAKRLKSSTYEEVPVWHAVARYVEGKNAGRLAVDGNRIPCSEFRADDGLREVLDTMRAVAGAPTC